MNLVEWKVDALAADVALYVHQIDRMNFQRQKNP